MEIIEEENTEDEEIGDEKKHKHEIDMTDGSVLKKMLLFSFPLMGSSILQLLFNAADIIVIGRFAGDNSLAAVGATSSLINLLVNLFVGLAIGANVLTGVWLNLSFWYKREEKTSLAIVVTGAGLVSMLVFGFWCIPVWGYYGAAWARLASESTMVAVSWWLNRRFYPTPYDWRRIGEYVAAALAVFAVCEAVTACGGNKLIAYAFNIVLFAAYALYLVRRERIDVAALVKAALKRK